MHPEVVSDKPGSCPKCGMALEPVMISAGDDENPELKDMSRRFWVSVVLTAPPAQPWLPPPLAMLRQRSRARQR